MKYSSFKFGNFTLISILVASIMIVLSCENKVDLIPKSDLLTLPSLTAKDLYTVYTDSGRIQLILSSPLLEQFDNKTTPYSEFRFGMKVIFYNGKTDTTASVTAKYAKYTKNNNMWELRDSVVVINENKDKLETELLFWNQTDDLIYTDRFFKITNTDQVTQGFGFESDAHLNNRKLKKVNAIIYLKDE
jgi:LPS export ABC transporter protein LptC